ncbi:LysR family transcriptional regulator [Actinoallomurus vinaceus]|uniref:helix-turn-helix domain-containing protein n=1 Tax=Actinoallomurus vinaceus TaxID=1080074 RepID=UPI0031E75F40
MTRAAERLHLAQQAVSTHIQQLERALGVTLLVRTSRGVVGYGPRRSAAARRPPVSTGTRRRRRPRSAVAAVERMDGAVR